MRGITNIIILLSLLAWVVPAFSQDFLQRCDISGEHGGYSIDYNANPKSRDLKFRGDDRLKYYSTTCFVKPGETPRVVIRSYAETRPIAQRHGANSCDLVFTVEGGVYEGKQDNKSRHDGWKLPVKTGWNKAVIKADAYAWPDNRRLTTLRQEVSFYVFVIQVEKAGQVVSPFSGYPEVTASYIMPSHDGTVYAGLQCFSRPRGGGSKYAMVHMEPNGRIIKIYEIHPDVSGKPFAYDSEGGFYAHVMEYIVRFKTDGSFDRPIVAFRTRGIDSEITARHLKEKIYPTTVHGKKTGVPVYPDLSPSASDRQTVINGKYVYFTGWQSAPAGGGRHEVLCRLNLETGEIDKLGALETKDGPVAGPGGLMYMRKKTEKGRTPLGSSIRELLGYDANGRIVKSLEISDQGYWLYGFDGAGNICTERLISADGFRASTSMSDGRLRHHRLSTPTRYTDMLTGGEVRDNAIAAQGGGWMYRGSYYSLFREDGIIGKFTSQDSGVTSAPPPQPAVVKLAGKGFFSGGGSKRASPSSQPSGGPQSVPVVGQAGSDGGPEQINEVVGEDWSSESSDDRDSVPATPGEAAAAGAVAGGLSALAAWLMMRANGVGLKDVIELGGVAPHVPSEQINERDYVDGEVNDSGEVWSENSGWVGRDIYEQDKATREMINRVNRGSNAASDPTAAELGRKWIESQRSLEDMRETGKYVDMSYQLADKFGENQDEKNWCRDFVNRHSKPSDAGYQIDSETARRMYDGLKKQMYESGQIANEAELEYQTAADKEIGRKTVFVEAVRDNAARANRVLAKFDPTGTGDKILAVQQGAYSTINGYEEGGIAGAAEAAALSVADNYTQGYASTNYNATKEAYAEYGLSSEDSPEKSVVQRLVEANAKQANNQYNFLDHAGQAISHAMDGEVGKAFDSTMDAVDAQDNLRKQYSAAKDGVNDIKAIIDASQSGK